MVKLEADFRTQQRYKDATSRTLESRLRTARYLGARSLLLSDEPATDLDRRLKLSSSFTALCDSTHTSASMKCTIYLFQTVIRFCELSFP